MQIQSSHERLSLDYYDHFILDVASVLGAPDQTQLAFMSAGGVSADDTLDDGGVLIRQFSALSGKLGECTYVGSSYMKPLMPTGLYFSTLSHGQFFFSRLDGIRNIHVIGPELSLAVVGVALAGPGLAVDVRDSGAYIVRRVQTLKNAPDLILKLQEVGRAVCGGRLQASIDIAEYAFGLEDLNKALHADLVRGLEQMQEQLIKIDKLLESLMEADGSTNRAKLMLPPLWTWRADAKRIPRRFDKIQNNFQLTIAIAEARHRSLSVPAPLPATRYMPRLEVDGLTWYTALEEHIWQGTAETRDESGQPISIEVLIERTKESLGEIPSIAGKLIKNRQEPGLKCLGYHKVSKPPHQSRNGLPQRNSMIEMHQDYEPYLVFQFPDGFGNPSTLRQTIAQTLPSEQRAGGGHTLEDRMRLAHLILESLLFVHGAEFVHKNIRLDTILLFRSQSAEFQDPTRSLVSAKPYLTY